MGERVVRFPKLDFEIQNGEGTHAQRLN